MGTQEDEHAVVSGSSDWVEEAVLAVTAEAGALRPAALTALEKLLRWPQLTTPLKPQTLDKLEARLRGHAVENAATTDEATQ